jgi:ferredoxin-fold anticodon binding domain-containing protein
MSFWGFNMAKMEIWKKERRKLKVKTIRNFTPEIIDDEVILTFVGDHEKYIVKIPRIEMEDFFKGLKGFKKLKGLV